MEKISTVQVLGNEILKERKLIIGVDLGDRWSFYCVLDEAEPDMPKCHRGTKIDPGRRESLIDILISSGLILPPVPSLSERI